MLTVVSEPISSCQHDVAEPKAGKDVHPSAVAALNGYRLNPIAMENSKVMRE